MYKILSVVALLLAVASASHYRYGTMTYVPTGTRTLRIQVDQAWRRSFFGAPNVNNIIIPGVLTFGDGQTTNLQLTVTSVNLVDDIAAGTSVNSHTYGSNTHYTIGFNTCCRIGSLQNNANGNLNSFATVDFANYPNNRSPVSNVLPIVIVGRGTPATFQVTAIDPDQDALTFRLATSNEFDGNHPPGTSINSITGLYSWNNVGLTAGLWNTAVVITDGKCLVMVDFLMSLTDTVAPSNNPPTWVSPTPADGASFSVQINNPISFTLTCNDADAGNTVTIQAGSLPQGSVLSAQSGIDPGTRTFSYTSSTPSTSVACFQCNDNFNAVAGQRCFSLSFIGTCCDIHNTPPVLNGVPSDLSVECGNTIQPPPTVTATPICPDGSAPTPVTPSVTDVGSNCNRVITRTWSFTDTCGRTSTASQVITVKDTTLPTIDSSAAASTTVECGSSTAPSATGSVTGSDTCYPNVNIGSTDTTSSSSCLSVASISRRWTATDACNNVASYTQTINIVDSQAPALTVPNSRTVECGNPTDVNALGFATASDVCDSSVTPTYSDSTASGSCPGTSVITRTWDAKDDCGNSVQGVQTITVQDTTAPTSSVDPVCVFPPNGLFYCFDLQNPDFLHASDVCSAVTHFYNADCHDASGDVTGCVQRGTQLCVRASTDHVSDNTYSFSFTVQDGCGNTHVQPATITVPNMASGASSSCRVPDTCINHCPEGTCEGSTFDLVTEDEQNIGSVYITNKLDYELDIEVKTNEGAIPDRGWWMLGLNIQVGSRRVVKEWPRSQAQSRWFATVDLTAALSHTATCGSDVSVIIAVLATNDKSNNHGASIRAYPNAGSKRTFPLPPNIQDYAFNYNLCCECTMRTQTQNDFGNPCYQSQVSRTSDSPRVRAIACYTYDFWTWSSSWCFPSGITVGCTAGYTATWTTPAAIQTGWADETTARVLTQNYVNPAKGSVGLLAAEAGALTLNIKLDECDAEWSTSCNHLEDYYVCRHPTSIDRTDCQPFWGQTVSSILAQANSVVGGCSSGDVNALAICVRYINREFVDGKRLWEAADFQTGGCATSS